MHLHFSSTPSRSNAAIREVARCFRRKNPEFLLSASGFHSLAHLLVRLGLGRSHLACFFGDNYPVPRPNALYQGLAGGLGRTLHVLSLLSYVEALRAGAMGQPFALNRSLLGTDMGRELERAGYLTTLGAANAGSAEGMNLGLLKAIRPDVTFVHALLGDERGNVVVCAPTSEGFWAANGAKRGVIVTVERVVSSAEVLRFKDAMPIARHQVLAVCEAPGGAHPQALFADPRFGVAGYEDDFEHYLLWRRLATDDALFAHFEKLVLDAPDGEAGYAEFLCVVAAGGFRAKARTPLAANSGHVANDSEPQDALFVSAARAICRKVKEQGYELIIAGIGGSFYAARLAKLWLEREGIDVDVIVETGLIGLECGPEGDDFLLSHRNMARSERLSNVEDALGVLCSGSKRCLGVIGAAEVDATGAINSTRSPSGQFLVGSGGANDIAAAAAEVIVTVRCDPQRMVDAVGYTTSSGQRVSEVVTELATFSRANASAPWVLSSIFPRADGRPLADAVSAVRGLCPWPCSVEASELARPISRQERQDLEAIRARPRNARSSAAVGQA